MSTATKGRRGEHRVRAILEAAGYSVIRAAGGRLGEILKATDRNEGRPGPGRGKAGTPAAPAFADDPPTLAELGIAKKLSSLAQKLAGHVTR